MRVLFVNSGILGHGSVAGLLRDAAGRMDGVEAVHVDLSQGLTPLERTVRAAMCAGPAPGTAGGALSQARFRHELHAGVLAARRIAAAEREAGPFDVLHFHPQPTAWASVRRMRRTPSIVSIDVTQRLAAGPQAGRLARLEHAPCAARDRRVFRAAAAVTTTSQWVADDLAAQLPVLAERIHTMPYPVRLEGFDRGWMDERAQRAARGEPVVVLFVGGDFPRKGGPELLRAWDAAEIADRAVLRLVTDWPLALAALPRGVTVHPGIRAYSPRWFDAWRRADVFAMPTRAEAFGMVYQEAAAAGVPAIGTRIAAIPEIVGDGRAGLLVPPDDVPALADALRRLVDAPALRRTMGEAARHRIEETGSMDRYAARLRDLLHDAAGRERHG